MGSAIGAMLLFTSLHSASAQESPPERVSSAIVYGDDPCPEPQGDEIVVCAQRPESERYRIPKEVREKEEKERISEQSWGSRVEGLDDAARFTRPNSCSVVGSGGQTGCFEQMLREWSSERRGR
jgi:hypothetical protein